MRHEAKNISWNQRMSFVRRTSGGWGGNRNEKKEKSDFWRRERKRERERVSAAREILLLYTIGMRYETSSACVVSIHVFARH